MSLISACAQSSTHPVTLILNFRGRFGVLAVAGEERRDGLDDDVRVEELVGVDAGDRAAEHVAGGIAAGLHARDVDLFEQPPDLRHVLDAHPVDLDVLAGADVAVAIPPAGMVLGTAANASVISPMRRACRASSGHRAPSDAA